ncbi:hypothetical protein [Gimesia fumaroli]|uniref:Uncharacterized protein n=1 Tax=Gimesia fumaroli TaxID=2527976 RepID=A0A518IIW8_9PLAN|nr:hypothetical protein [Gimesia fumaroli]QDV53039.1 hypothetical protein Enr17x_51090 [Gimesia fumaroli]
MALHYAFRLSLIAFATESVRGILSHTDFIGATQSALVAAVIFFGLGLVLGEVATRLVEESARASFEKWKNNLD